MVKLLPRHRKVKGLGTAAPPVTGSEKIMKKSSLKCVGTKGFHFYGATTFRIMTLGITAFGITATLRIMKIDAECCYTECHFFCVSSMHYAFMHCIIQSVVMLTVVAPL